MGTGIGSRTTDSTATAIASTEDNNRRTNFARCHFEDVSGVAEVSGWLSTRFASVAVVAILKILVAM